METQVCIQADYALEVIWDAPKFVIDGADLISRRATAGNTPAPALIVRKKCGYELC
jgi:hypothetical protein